MASCFEHGDEPFGLHKMGGIVLTAEELFTFSGRTLLN